MVDKIYVLVIVPKLEMEFDVLIPTNRKISFIKEKIIQGVNELIQNSKVTINNMKFYDIETAMEYDEKLFLKQTNIRNGTSLILI